MFAKSGWKEKYETRERFRAKRERERTSPIGGPGRTRGLDRDASLPAAITQSTRYSPSAPCNHPSTSTPCYKTSFLTLFVLFCDHGEYAKMQKCVLNPTVWKRNRCLALFYSSTRRAGTKPDVNTGNDTRKRQEIKATCMKITCNRLFSSY